MMDAGMLGLMLKGFGIDPQAIIKQATAIGTAFETLQGQLSRIEANQVTIMTHMGLMAPEMPPDMLRLIAVESQRHIDPVRIEAPPIRAVG